LVQNTIEILTQQALFLWTYDYFGWLFSWKMYY